MNVAQPLLIRADAHTLPLPDASVDLVVTSPPYFGLRDYGYSGQIGAEPTPTDYLDTLIGCTAEMARVLKPSGSIWINLGDKYDSTSRPGASASSTLHTGSRTHAARRPVIGRPKSLLLVPERYRIRAVDELGLIARAVVIWSKPNGLPESVTDRVRRSHEDWVHLTKAPRYYSAVDEIRAPHARSWTPGRTGGHTYQRMKPPGEKDTNLANSAPNALGALPGSVWEIATHPLKVPAHLGVDHFAAFPMQWPRRIITGWSPRQVCTGCGQGRQPLVDTWRMRGDEPVSGAIYGSGKFATGTGRRHTERTDRTLTGYACACPDTAAPATPGVVLDPFSGTGTTALVAAMLGRTGIGVELSADYIRLARWRCADPKERARAAGLEPEAVAAINPQIPGQVGLFDLNGGAA